MISMVIGVALVVLVGLGRCITLAAGSVMAIGAYVSTLSMIHLGVPYGLALLLAILAGAAAGWLIALPGTRFRGHNLAMVTLVFQSVCIILIREAKWLTGGAEGIHVPRPSILGWHIATDTDFLLIIGVLSAGIVLVLTVPGAWAFRQESAGRRRQRGCGGGLRDQRPGLSHRSLRRQLRRDRLRRRAGGTENRILDPE